MRRCLAMLLLMLLPAAAAAQYRPTGVAPISGIRQAPPVETPKFGELISAASFIDSAMPRNTVRTRVDFDWRNRRPTRADYLYSKDGLPLPETRIDAQALDMYVEYALGPWFSFFLSQPYRWVNPEINANESGGGNIQLGLKFAFLDTESFLTTFQFRATAPTAAHRSLESRHWAIEPALLANWKIFPFLTLEGEARYWMPLTDQDYAGDVGRAGLAVVYGQRSPGEIWMIPVAEVVGWTVLGGKVDVVEPHAIDVQGARGQSILNAALGVRMGLGSNLEFYGGYNRCLTGTTWYKDMVRIEFRWLY